MQSQNIEDLLALKVGGIRILSILTGNAGESLSEQVEMYFRPLVIERKEVAELIVERNYFGIDPKTLNGKVKRSVSKYITDKFDGSFENILTEYHIYVTQNPDVRNALAVLRSPKDTYRDSSILSGAYAYLAPLQNKRPAVLKYAIQNRMLERILEGDEIVHEKESRWSRIKNKFSRKERPSYDDEYDLLKEYASKGQGSLEELKERIKSSSVSIRRKHKEELKEIFWEKRLEIDVDRVCKTIFEKQYFLPSFDNRSCLKKEVLQGDFDTFNKWIVDKSYASECKREILKIAKEYCEVNKISYSSKLEDAVLEKSYFQVAKEDIKKRLSFFSVAYEDFEKTKGALENMKEVCQNVGLEWDKEAEFRVYQSATDYCFREVPSIVYDLYQLDPRGLLKSAGDMQFVRDKVAQLHSFVSHCVDKGIQINPSTQSLFYEFYDQIYYKMDQKYIRHESFVMDFTKEILQVLDEVHNLLG